ncbi:TnsA endonuclease N-terminal domain-containing protein [Methyloversatilis discipulorum]|uniref:TnsA endonuclease N-terminal domain-containing protein n=1 Tax=Methyloversatilis discipulorum TaxID=1119528 RepID=UPI0026E95503|nr:TnsA endonuclease N-terminal domain-containing protein [Methyloversatilis discipulorum]
MTINKDDCHTEDNAPPARKIGPTRRSVSGQYVFRGKKGVAFESTLERDFIIRMEFILAVDGLRSQPVTIPFTGHQGRTFPYTPDFLVRYRQGLAQTELYEVKSYAEWSQNWSKWKSKWKAARRYAKQQGWRFRIFDESRIHDVVFENARYLERYKAMTVPPDRTEPVLSSVPVHQRVSIGRLLDEHPRHVVLHLIAIRTLDFDVNEPLDPLDLDLTVWRTES